MVEIKRAKNLNSKKQQNAQMAPEDPAQRDTIAKQLEECVRKLQEWGFSAARIESAQQACLDKSGGRGVDDKVLMEWLCNELQEHLFLELLLEEKKPEEVEASMATIRMLQQEDAQAQAASNQCGDQHTPRPAHADAGGVLARLRALCAAKDWWAGAALEAEGVAAAAALRTGGSPGKAGEIYNCLGECYNDGLERYDRALPLYEQACGACEAAGDHAGVGRACWGLGDCYGNMGQHDRALPLYEKARAECAAAGDGAGVGRACEGLGDCYQWMGQHDKALPLLEQARAAAAAAGDGAGVGRACKELGTCYHNMGQPAKALPWYEQARAALAAAGDGAAVGRACESLGNSHHNMGQPAKALQWYEQARAAFAAAGDGAGVARVCACLSNRRRRATAQGWRGCAGACPTF